MVALYLYIVTCYSDSRRRFGLDVGFTDHLEVVTTNNYSTIADFHTLPNTPEQAKSFQPFISRFLATDFNTVIITVSHCNYNTHKVFPSLLGFQLSTQSQNYFTTGSLPPISSFWR
jgi:hypothetical protein